MICKISSHGWSNPIGRAEFLATTIRSVSSKGDIHWQGLASKAIRLEHAASLLVIQGMQLQKLFDGHTFLEAANRKLLGPFILLRCKPLEFWNVPLQLSDVVLAKVESIPKDLKQDELLDVLLKDSKILTNSF